MLAAKFSLGYSLSQALIGAIEPSSNPRGVRFIERTAADATGSRYEQRTVRLVATEAPESTALWRTHVGERLIIGASLMIRHIIGAITGARGLSLTALDFSSDRILFGEVFNVVIPELCDLDPAQFPRGGLYDVPTLLRDLQERLRGWTPCDVARKEATA